MYIKILFLKCGLLNNLLAAEFHSARSHDKLVLNVILPVYHSDNAPLKNRNRVIHAQNIRVLLLTVTRKNARYVTVINRITNSG